MTAPDPQTAADAAERVQRWLDEWSFKVQGNHVVTGCGRDEPDGCTELTAPDIDALLRDRVRLLAELEQVRGERDEARDLAQVSLDILRNVSDESMSELFGVDSMNEMPKWFTRYGP